MGAIKLLSPVSILHIVVTLFAIDAELIATPRGRNFSGDHTGIS